MDQEPVRLDVGQDEQVGDYLIKAQFCEPFQKRQRTCVVS